MIPWLANEIVMATVMVDGQETFPQRTAAIAATHSVFNIVNTIIFLPFVPLFVRLLTWLVPAKDFKEKPRLTDLDVRMLDTPLMAIDQSHQEIQRMGDGCAKMLVWLEELMGQNEPDQATSDRLRKREQVLDSIQDEVAVFVTNLLSGNVPHAVADEARRQIRMADEYESVSDYICDLEKFDRKLRRDEHRFTETQRTDLSTLNQMTSAYLNEINEGLAQSNANILAKTSPMSKNLRSMIKQLRRKHLEDLSTGNISPLVSVAYLASLNAYARVRDHSQNIAEAVSGEK